MHLEESETRLTSECYLPLGFCRAGNIPSTLIGKSFFQPVCKGDPGRCSMTRGRGEGAGFPFIVLGVQIRKFVRK